MSETIRIRMMKLRDHKRWPVVFDLDLPSEISLASSMMVDVKEEMRRQHPNAVVLMDGRILADDTAATYVIKRWELCENFMALQIR